MSGVRAFCLSFEQFVAEVIHDEICLTDDPTKAKVWETELAARVDLGDMPWTGHLSYIGVEYRPVTQSTPAQSSSG